MASELQLILRDTLTLTFTDLDQLIELVFEATGKNLDELVDQGNVKTRIMRLIRLAETESWLPALLGAGVKLRPEEPRFAALLAQLQPHPFPPLIDHYEAPWLDSSLSRAMVNRIALRTALRQLEDPLSGVRILVVDGGRETGKSYSRDFIEYLQLTLRTFTVASVDLLQVGVSEVLAEHLGWQLADRFGVMELPARDNEQGGKWVSRVANRLALAMKTQKLEDGQTQWIVIDGFNNVQVAQETRDLVAQIAWRVASELVNVRLVLLSYRKAALPVEIAPKIAEEIIDIQIDQIGNHIRPLLALLYTARSERDNAFQYTPGDVDQSVNRVLSELDSAPPRTLRMLSAALVKVAKEKELLR